MANTIETKKFIGKDYEKGKYFVQEIDKTESWPDNYVLHHPEYNNFNFRKYTIVKHDIFVSWSYGTYQGNSLTFYKDKLLLQKVMSPSMQVVCEYLNKFEAMSSEEFEKFEEKARENAEK